MAEFTTKCPRCKTELTIQEEWIGMEAECPECRHTFVIPRNNAPDGEALPKCLNCGHDLQPGTKFCPECGTPAADAAHARNRKSKTRARTEASAPAAAAPPEEAENGAESTPKSKTSRRKVKKDAESPTGESASKEKTPRKKVKKDGEQPAAETAPGKKISQEEEKKETDSSSEEAKPAEVLPAFSKKKNDDPGCVAGAVILAILGGGIWLLWILLTGFPRTCFWIIAPIAGLLILFGIGFKGGKAILTILLTGGIIWWGWWAHTKKPSSDASAPTSRAAAENSAPSASAPRSRDEKISITVRVQQRYTTGIVSYKFANEYKLYADGECIATKHDTMEPVFFNASVRRDAVLRAEILVKNGFGAIVESHSGPDDLLDKKMTAYSPGSYEIKCL